MSAANGSGNVVDLKGYEDDLPPLLGQTLSRAGLKDLPKPEPLLEGWLDLRTAGLLIGASGTNKTFAMLGWACSIATGVPWMGCEVTEQAPVALVVGEGGSGLNARIDAWERAHRKRVPADMLTVYLRPRSINDAAFWPALAADLADREAVFVGFDTYSSLAPDADETKDAAKVVRRMTDLAMAIDGCAVLAHHTGWGEKDRARGGSQFEANADFVVLAQAADPDNEDSPVKLRRKKVKEGASGEYIWVERDTSGESCVLKQVNAPDSAKRKRANWSGQIEELLRDEPEQYRSKTAVLTALKVPGGRQFQEAGSEWDDLVTLGRIHKKKGAKTYSVNMENDPFGGGE